MFSMFAAATLLLATSCQQDEVFVDGNDAVVTFEVGTPQIATRAYSDGLTAKNLQWAVYNEDNTPVKRNGELLSGDATLSEGKASVSIQLAAGKNYKVLFWAEAVNAPYNVDFETQKLSVVYTNATSNDENRDAFYCYHPVQVEKANKTETVKLRRPFAQLNIGTNDLNKLDGVSADFTQVTVPVYSTLNLATGIVEGTATKQTFAFAARPASETFPVTGYNYYLAMNYLLVGKDKAVVDVTFSYDAVDNATAKDEYTRTYTGIPVQANYRTNIYGALLTQGIDFDVEIEPDYNEPDNDNSATWDGVTKVEPQATATEYLISSAAEWAWLKGKNLNGKNIKLTANIDFNGYEVTGLGFKGTLDGQGFTMSNMTLLCGASYYSNGLLCPQADATVKNLTIENVIAECGNENQGYVGAIFGDTQNNMTLTLENVHVVNADLCGVQSVGGLVGFVASGTTVNMKDCSVSESYLHNYAVDNESGFVAGLVGRPVGTVTAEDCEVNSTKIEAFYAERRGESSIQAAIGGQASPAGVTVGADVEVVKTDLSNVVMVSTAAQLGNLTASNKIIILTADIDFAGATMTHPIEMWGNSTFDGQGHKISNVVAAEQGGYATALFRGDANSGEKLIKNVTIENITATGASFAAAVWSDVQNAANITIDNVNIYNATIQSPGTIGGFIGFVGSGTTNITIKNSSINNSTLSGGEAAHKRGAVVGRAYGCMAILDNVAVNNVTINDVAANHNTVAGDKGYTGTVTIDGIDMQDGKYLIKSAKGLQTFAKLVNVDKNNFAGKTVELGADIDLAGIDWEPIGQTGNAYFKGTFDGKGHTISNLSINTTDKGGSYSSGLFGWIQAATIKGVNIEGAEIYAQHYVGAIAGYMEWDNCNIVDCHVNNATIVAEHNSVSCGNKVGAIVGYAGNSGNLVKDCTASNSTIKADRDAGQIVGAAIAANVVNCSATNVSVSGTTGCTDADAGKNIRNEVIGRVL